MWKEDFEGERRDREQAASRMDDERAELHENIAQLQDELRECHKKIEKLVKVEQVCIMYVYVCTYVRMYVHVIGTKYWLDVKSI